MSSVKKAQLAEDRHDKETMRRRIQKQSSINLENALNESGYYFLGKNKNRKSRFLTN